MTAPLQEQLIADRAKLRHLSQCHPDWSCRQFMEATARSRAWVKNWLRRFKSTPPHDQAVLWGKTRASRKPPLPPDPRLLDRLLELRTNPPNNLKRIPGPKALAYFLAHDPYLQEQGIKPPSSTSTIYKYLIKLGCIARPGLCNPKPIERPEPLESIAIDFKDASTVEIEPDGKQQHLVEVLNFVDEGTSVLWEAVASADFNAETVVETLLGVFEQQGLPRQLRFDRDPRFVGSASSRDFPAAMVRMLHVLGVQPAICPPHQPQKNPFAERYNRAYKYECLLVKRPANLSEVKEVTGEYKTHYNYERPHQGRGLNNQPPRVAFASLPALPSLPLIVDPDSWLKAIAGERFTRKVRADGGVSLDKYDYFVGQEWAGQYVALVIDSQSREVVVEHEKQVLKRLNLKGLIGRLLSLEEWKEVLKQEARSERRGWRPSADQ